MQAEFVKRAFVSVVVVLRPPQGVQNGVKRTTAWALSRF
jgi:hypothetical protein